MNQSRTELGDSSVAMAIDAAASTTKKRAITEVDKSDRSDQSDPKTPADLSDSSSNVVQMTESNLQDAPDQTGLTLDIAWREIFEHINPFRNHEPAFLPLSDAQTHIQANITE